MTDGPAPRQSLRFPLTHKLVLAALALFLLLSLGASLLFFFEARAAARLALDRQGEAITSTLGYSIEILLDNNDLQSIQRVVSNSALLPDVRQVIVADRSGKVIASSDRLELGMVSESPHLRGFLSRGELGPAMIEGQGGDLFILRPLRRGRYQSANDTGVIGAIQITVDRRSIEADAELGTLRMLAIHLGGYALLSLLLALALRGIVVRPLYRLAEAAGRVRAGDRSVRSAIRSRDEIGVVSEAFDRMAAEVERTVGTLEDKVRQRTVALQREVEDKSAAFADLERAHREANRINDELVRAQAETERAHADLVRTQAETDRLKGDIISVVSHELRTPLTAIRGAIGLLVGGVMGPLPDEPKELLTIAQRNTLRLIALVNDILDLDRLQRGIFDLRIGRVESARIVERSVEAVAAFAQEEGVCVDIANSEGVVAGDEGRLVQVLVNLLSNAIKFSPPLGRVIVSAAVLESEVEFRVTDLGPGISAAHRDMIFERFYQVEEVSTRARGGTGLGLSISKAIVEQHGGRIELDSEEGAGSTFCFRLPCAPSQETG